jgi:hypothetical protein
VPPGTETQLPDATLAFGRTLDGIKRIAKESDILWNFAGGLDRPIRDLFPRSAYIDGDPAMVQLELSL